MKAIIRNIGTTALLSILVIFVSAASFATSVETLSEPGLNDEVSTTGYSLFDAERFNAGINTVVDIADANPNFSILVEAVAKSELSEALSADGSFTIFVPTNKAFENLFKELGVNGISDLSSDQLSSILTYHMISGKIMSEDLSDSQFSTLNGKAIRVDLSEGVTINKSKVIAVNILGINGVIHVIDKVLLP